MLFKHYRHLMPQTIFVQQLSIRRGTAEGVTGLAAMMEAVQTGITGMLFVHVLLSALSLSSLRGVRSCGGHHSRFGSRLDPLQGCSSFAAENLKIKPAPHGALTNQRG